MAFEGKHKIADKFEKETYHIVDQPRPEIPVFKMKSDETGMEKTLHRNLLVKEQGHEVTEDVDVANTDDSVETVEVEETDKILEVKKMHDVMPNNESDYEDGQNVYKPHLYGDAHKSVVGAQQKEVEVPHKHQVDRLEENEDDKKIVENENGKDDVEEEDEDHPHSEETEDELQGQRDGQDRTENKDTKGDEDKDAAIEHQHADLPILAPRSSSRLKKPPDRLGDNVSKVLSPRLFDNRLHALQELMNSGIINNLDSEKAHRLIAAIMNGCFFFETACCSSDANFELYHMFHFCRIIFFRRYSCWLL